MGDPNEFLAALEGYVARALVPFQTRIAQLEATLARAPERGEKGEAGERGPRGLDAEVDYERIGNVIAVAVEKEVAKLPTPQNGRDAAPVDYAHIAAMIKAAAITAVAELPRSERGQPGPAGKDGAPGADGAKGEPGEIGPQGLPGAKGEPGEPGKPGEKGEAGRDVTQEALAAAVDRALGAWARPVDGRDGKDGKDAPAPDLAVLRAFCAEAVAALPPAPRGEKGEPGAKGDPGEPGRDGQRGPEGPIGQQGDPGRDALDGLSSIEASLRDERTLALDFLLIGGRRKSFAFRLPIPIYRGLHRDGAKHEQGDAVTRDGSTWIATKDTDTAPPSPDWTLAVKKGRDLR